MLTDALVISFSRNFWDDVWRSRQQVMSRLARTNRVVFVSRALLLGEVMPWVRVSSPLRSAGAHKVHDSLYAYVPPRYLPRVFRPRAVERAFARLRRQALKRFVARWNGERPILYVWHPTFEPYLDAFPDSLICYHLFDDLASNDDEARGTGPALERIFKRADLIFASSQDLADRYKRFGNVYWVPNGVDYDSFAASTAANEPPPADLARIPRPRIGYAGTVRSQIDVALLLRIARARPDWSVVLIGDITRSTEESDDFQDLRAHANVHVLGQRHTTEMPASLRHLDVGLLPYRLDGAARFCYPLKMHEYLAAGIPVVSSSLPAVMPFTSVIKVADRDDEWLDAIAECLADTSAARVAERQRVASENSWDRRVEHISTLIADTRDRRTN